MQIRMFGATDIGKLRKVNQDRIFFDEALAVGIVADGIGGRVGGEVAATIAVNTILAKMQSEDVINPGNISIFLRAYLEEANRAILDHTVKEPSLAGMGTTLNCLWFTNRRLYITHVGDSRTYLFDRGNFWQITIDHNVREFVARGLLPGRSNGRPLALVRALGLTERVECEVYELNLSPGQVFLTCSDGLTGMVSDRKIARLINENMSQLDRIPTILINEANRNGGKDNITLLISQVLSA